MNLPNKITISRILLMFVFLVVCNIDELFKDDVLRMWCRAVGLLFAIIAGFTDILDGYLARKYDQVTDFGKLMDPLADKIFTATTFIMLVDKGLLPGWVAVVVLSREFMVTGLRLLAARKGEVIPADITGKVKTVIQMVFLAFGGSMWLGWISPKDDTVRVVWLVFYLCVVVVTVSSGVSYFVRHRNLYGDA
jgi:CDP-diacylglycerol--glycerol-3-phosphate 3-phosphatidyltransferase